MQKTETLSKNITWIALLLVTCTSCYRMPGENDYCIIPTTNNPDVTRHKADPLPTVDY